jgi:DinB superfamily
MTPEHEALVQHIRSAATMVSDAVGRVPPHQADRPPRDGEWSVREILVHLRNVVVMVQGLRLRRLLYERDPVFADYDEETYRREDLAKGESIGDLAGMIVAEHEQVARLLATLPDERWQRQGRHPELGAMSIEFLARRIGEHAEEHARQIAETVR